MKIYFYVQQVSLICRREKRNKFVQFFLKSYFRVSLTIEKPFFFRLPSYGLNTTANQKT